MTWNGAWWSSLLGLLLVTSVVRPLAGEEPAAEFLEGLRRRGYYDIGLEYLESVRDSASVSPSWRESIDLEHAVLLLEASRVERDRQIRQQQLTEAQTLLRQFIEQHPQHSKTNAARTQLGNLVAEQARRKMESVAAGDGEARSEAQALYEKAYEIYVSQRDQIRTQLEGIPPVLDPNNPQQAALLELRDQLRKDYLYAQLLAAAIREEQADTAPPGSTEREAMLRDAAEQYEDMYRKYRGILTGITARMYQGRVYQKLGRLRDALGYYVELLEQPDQPEPFRLLKTKTLRLATECWLDASEQKYVEVIRRCNEWLAKIRPDEEREPDWLALRMHLARAYLMQAADKSPGEPVNSRTIMQARNEAQKQAQIVARYDSEFQQEAQRILVELGGKPPLEAIEEIKTFEQAHEAGRQLIDSIGPALHVVQTLETQQGAATDPQVRGELQLRLDAARTQLLSIYEQAGQRLHQALELATPETSIIDINLVRYLLAYLYFQQEDYYDAAALSEFVARHYPAGTGAQQCAKIALACYLQLYQKLPEEDREFATKRILSIAEFTANRWPSSVEAQDAMATLVPFLIDSGEVARAREFLDRLPGGSPHRAAGALRLGKALWQQYLRTQQDLQRGEQAGNAGDSAAQREELARLLSEAEPLLAQGVAGLPDDESLDEGAITGLLSLAQVRVAQQQAAAAIELLEAPQHGLLALAEQGPSTRIPGLREQIYQTALQAYVVRLADAPDPAPLMQRADAVMREMQATLGTTPEGQKRLVAIYLSLARNLESQLRQASPDTRRVLSRGFEAFLQRLSRTSTDVSVLSWVAETFSGLAARFGSADPLPADARRYYEASAAAFQQILAQPDLAADLRPTVLVRLANVRRQQGEFDAALQIFRDLLTQQNAMLNVQEDAAMTLQEAQRYEDAIMGLFPDTESRIPVVWGWGKIAQVAARYPQFAEDFHQARYNLALCRFRWAETQQGAERVRLLDMALKDIDLTRRLYGLGDDAWPDRYAALEGQIRARKNAVGRIN